MCIAILNRGSGEPLTKETFENCWRANSDGGGFMFAIDGRIRVFKEMKSVDTLYEMYEAMRSLYPEIDFVIHFRITTHGATNLTNCHPHMVNRGLAFVHNGIIQGFGDKEKSDTVEFCEKILRKLPRNFVEHEGVRRLIRLAGGWSKFIFLSKDGSTRIINEEAGTEFEGNWFSNCSFKTPEVSKHSYAQYAKYFNNRWNHNDGYNGRHSKKKGGDSRINVSHPFSTTEFPKGLPQATEDSAIDYGDTSQWEEAVESPFEDSYFNVSDETAKKYSPPRCSECDGELPTRMERYYGACQKCLREYGLLDN
jgi:predicted glutamine amidotransferase